MALKYLEEFRVGSSTQGRCGVVEDESGTRKFFKISKNFNYTACHEFLVLSSVNRFTKFLPHFPLVYPLQEMSINPTFRDSSSDPFTQNQRLPSITTEVLFMELLNSKKTFSEYIRSKHRKNMSEVVHSVARVLVVVKISQALARFTHNDLHTDNVLMVPCDYAHAVYKHLDKLYVFPTYGVSPVFIDFGYSYVDEVRPSDFSSTVELVNYGVVPFLFNPYIDMCVFLCNAADVLEEHGATGERVEKFFEAMKVFDEYDFLRHTGHVKVNRRVKGEIAHMLGDDMVHAGCRSFNSYFDATIDIVLRLVDFRGCAEGRVSAVEAKAYLKDAELPLRESYKVFLREFVKIERLVGNSFYVMYILRTVVNYIGKNRLQLDSGLLKTELIRAFNSISLNIWPEDFATPVFLGAFIAFVTRLDTVMNCILTVYMSDLRETQRGIESLSLDSVLSDLMRIEGKYTIDSGETIAYFDCDAGQRRDIDYSRSSRDFNDPVSYGNFIKSLL